jgi:hypothetical protein
MAAPQPTRKRPPIPHATQLTILIQTCVAALSQANLTGDYSVLHALGAPAFQKNNPPDKLFQIFANMRSIDLSPTIIYEPILSREPAYDEQGLLHLVGYYETEPQQVHFDVTVQPVGGVWRLFGISVKTVPTQSVTGATPAPSSAAGTSDPVKESVAEKGSVAKKAAPKRKPRAGDPSKDGSAK